MTGAMERITCSLVPFPLGTLGVGVTPEGICFVGFCTNEEALVHAIVASFPEAVIRYNTSIAASAGDALRKWYNGEPVSITVDVRGTPFQHAVWQALQAIPRGQTRSYRDIAQSIGHPRAVRAVANACAANPVGLLIPCHRVVRSSGGIGGYAWGSALKEHLLAHESGAPHPRAKAA